MTSEQAAGYIANNGIKCPFCNSSHLFTGEMQQDGPRAWQGVTCHTCFKTWTDEYKIVGVSESQAV